MGTELQREVRPLWNKVVVEIEPEQDIGKALIAGINLRINVREALVAGWKTAEAVARAKLAGAVAFDLAQWLEAAVAGYDAVRAVFRALVQRMLPLDYATAVVLASCPDGTARVDLKNKVEGFLKDPNLAEFSWHFGMNADLARRAKEAASHRGWFEETLDRLRKSGFLTDQNDKLLFKSRHFTVGLKSGD